MAEPRPGGPKQSVQYTTPSPVTWYLSVAYPIIASSKEYSLGHAPHMGLGLAMIGGTRNL